MSDSARRLRHIGVVLCLTALTGSLNACGRQVTGGDGSAGALVERARVAMGSELRLSAWTNDEPVALAAFEAVFEEFERLDAMMSVWAQASEVVRINQAAGRAPVESSAEVREVLRTAKQVGDWTSGKFDVTFGALSDLWKFDHDQDNRIPQRALIAERLPLVDYRAVDVDDAKRTVFLSRQGMRVHLGGIGKGYAVDRAASLLRSRGISNFMIQAGGDMYVAGLRDGRPWRVGIRDPRGPAERSFATLELTDAAISTSGDYERYFLHGGRRYHHILDPDSGEPAAGARSVTIVADRSILADALATGVFVLGPDEGMALIERLQRVEGVIVTARNNLAVSSGLSRPLVVLAPPTDAP